MKQTLIKMARWIGAAVVLLQLVFSERKRRDWQATMAMLDAGIREIEQRLSALARFRRMTP